MTTEGHDMQNFKADALVVGHLCLDIIPGFLTGGVPLSRLFVPGKLIDIGDAVLGTGGAANNTGMALHRLGFNVRIVGKVGDDFFGGIVVKIIRDNAAHLVEDMIVSPGEGTSYSIVLNPPGIDRVVLHATAANDTFRQDEVSDAAIGRVRLLHFGYPPLMRQFYERNGVELKTLFDRARTQGVTTSLDMARPDPDGPSGQVDWPRFLEMVLPAVDIFLPSVDELLFMTDRSLFEAAQKKAGEGNIAAFLDIAAIRKTADRMLDMGAAIVGFKLGDQGFYLKVTGDDGRLAAMGRVTPPHREAWLGKELLSGCRRVTVAGTIGAGDCTIAGFLGSLLKGLSADEAVSMAVGVGGASVEVRDAYSGVPPWDDVRARLAAGWARMECGLVPEEWATTPLGNRLGPAVAVGMLDEEGVWRKSLWGAPRFDRKILRGNAGGPWGRRRFSLFWPHQTAFSQLPSEPS